MIDIEVIAADAGGEKVGLLPVSRLLARRNTRLADQFRHGAPMCLVTNGEYADSTRKFQDMVTRIADCG